ncbi:hypothetical protein U9M48_011679 [Paspalum notatum var. saurae]|uniref:Uncharacterized protein n=1 Tax=Paspalum notatum var. saurae TaxID=547442 RepID=A0AAQ3WHS8_PASNO
MRGGSGGSFRVYAPTPLKHLPVHARALAGSPPSDTSPERFPFPSPLRSWTAAPLTLPALSPPARIAARGRGGGGGLASPYGAARGPEYAAADGGVTPSLRRGTPVLAPPAVSLGSPLMSCSYH